MRECPDLDDGEPSADVRAHLASCAACSLVVQLLDERKRGLADRGRHDECVRFELLMAAREEGGLGKTAGDLLDAHLKTCVACSAVATTMPPLDRRGATELPAVSTAAYAIGREIARGGMGRILSAEDLRIGRPVAVKELLDSSPVLAARFEREARVTARLQHPGIVPIYEIGRWPDGTPFYTMRMVEGVTLREALRKRTTLDDRLALLPAIVAAAEAIAFAHGKRIVHRDLTPNNILVGAYGETVVIDWGLAKDLSDAGDDAPSGPYRDEPETTELTHAGAVVGTAKYMPPEQARGEAVDERADVYALGAILYHLLAGAAPHQGATNDDVLQALRDGAPTAIGIAAPGAPRDLVSLVDKAMARDRDGRYRTAGELAAELRRFQNGRVVEAHHYSRRERARRWVGRHTALVLASLVLAIAGSIGVIGIVRERDRAELGEAEAEASAALLLEDSGRQELLAGHSMRAAVWLSASYSAGNHRPALRFLLARAMHDLEARERDLACPSTALRPEVSPDGSLLAAACGKTAQIWRVVDGVAVASLPATHGTWRRAVFSHDSKRLLAWTDDGEASVASTSTAVVETRFVGHTVDILDAAFSSDDKLVATSGADRTVRVWDAATGAQLRSLDLSAAPPGIVRASFLGADLAAIASTGTITVWNAATGQLRTSIATGTTVSSSDLATFERVAVCGFDGVARVWDLAGARAVATFTAHGDAIWTCRLSPDRSQLLTTSSDGTAKVWDIASARLVLQVHPGGIVNTGAFFADGTRIATGVAIGGGVQVWDIQRGTLLGVDEGVADLHPINTEFGSMLVIGERLVSGDASTIHIWNHLGERAMTSFIAPLKTEIVAVGKERAVLSSPTAISIWDVRSDRAVPSLALRMPFAATTTVVAARTVDGVAVVALADGSTIAALPLADPPETLAISRDGRRLVVNAGGRAAVWDLATRTELASWTHTAAIAGISADGAVICVQEQEAGGEPRTEVWQVSPRVLVQTLAVGFDHLWSADFDRDATRVATVQGRINQQLGATVLWDLATGRRMAVIPGAAFPHLDATGERIAASFADRGEIWRLADAARIGSLVDAALPASLEMSPDGAFIGVAEAATGSFSLRDAEDHRLLESVRGPHSTVLTANGPWYVIPRVAFSTESSSVAISSGTRAMWLAIPREQRSPDEIARIVATRTRWRVDGAHLIEKVSATATLRGTVTHAGAPVAAASVEIRQRYTMGTGEFAVVTGADGSFEISMLPLGAIEVGAVSVATGAFTQDRPLELAAGENHLDLDLELAATLAGAIVDAKGAPRVGLHVHADCIDCAQNDSGDAVTTATGDFAMRALSGGGHYAISVTDNADERIAYAPLAPLAPIAVADGKAHVTGLRVAVARAIATSQAEVELPAHVGREASALRSHDGTKTTIRFANHTGESVDVFWIDDSGVRHRNMTIEPGIEWKTDTFVSHVWLAADSGGTIGVYVAVAAPGLVTLTR